MSNARSLSIIVLISLVSSVAMAASSAPSLGTVLGSSGINISGAVAASYVQYPSYAQWMTTASPSYEAGMTAQGHLQLDQAILSVAYQPQEGFGGVVDLASGESVSGQGGSVGGTGSASIALTQAYLQHKSGSLTIDAGRFYTSSGYEVFSVADNLFVSRSELFNRETTYHTGLRAVYALNDSLSLKVGALNNVFANRSESRATLENKAFELGAKWAASDSLSLAATLYQSKAETDLVSVVATYKFSDDFSVALNADQANGAQINDYTAVALYGAYRLNDNVKVGIRIEEINPGQKNLNGTGALAAVVSYSLNNNLDIRTELSNIDEEGAKPRRMAAAIQGVLKF